MRLIDDFDSGNQTAFAKRVGIPQSTLVGYLTEKGQGKIKAPFLQALVENLNVNSTWLLTGHGEIRGNGAGAISALGEHSQPVPLPGGAEGAALPVYAATGAGSAVEDWNPEPIRTVMIPPTFMRDGIVGLQVAGDSMEPRIKRGGLVGVDTNLKRLVGGQTYAVRLPYEGVTIKKVFYDPEGDKLVLKSDNPGHPDQSVPMEGRDLGDLLLGQVVWVLQET